MKDYKVPYPRYFRLGKSHKLTVQEIAKIKELRLEGWTQQRIADEMDVSYYTVAYHTNENIKKRIREQSLERYRMLPKEEQRANRNKHMRDKRTKMRIRYLIYRTPNAKTRKISNEEFMKIAEKSKIQ